MKTPAPIIVRTVSIEDAGFRAGLSRSRLVGLLDSGAIASIKLLDRRLVVVASLEAFLGAQRERAARDGRVRIPPEAA
jgi:hypothetical protein